MDYILITSNPEQQNLMLSRSKFFVIFVTLILCLIIADPARAQGGGGEGGGNVQSPVQLIVQIVVTATVLKVLHTFNLP